MRIALIADTHGALDPRIAERLPGADLLIHAGDVGQGIAEEIAALVDRVIIVAGNNDPQDCGWPQEQSVALAGGTLAVMHGHQWPARVRHDRLRAHFRQSRAIVCGHSHRRVLETDANPWLLNPGAAGRTRAYGGPGYIELEATQEAWHAQTIVFEPLTRAR